MSIVRTAAVVAGLALAQGALAEVNTRIVWQVSLDGSTWQGGEVWRLPGASYQVRAVVSYTGTASPMGLASFVFQPTIENWDYGYTVSPFVNGGVGGNTTNPLGVVPQDGPGFGRVSPWGRTALSTTNALVAHVTQQGHVPTPIWVRIAQRQATAWIGGAGNTSGGAGVPISQLSDVGRTSADPAFNSQLQNIVVFRMGMEFGTVLRSEPIVIDSPVEGFGNRNTATGEREVYWFASMTEVTGSIRGTAVVEPVRLVIPGPGAWVVALAGVIAVRRQRRGEGESRAERRRR